MMFCCHFIALTFVSYFLTETEATGPVDVSVSANAVPVAGSSEITLATCTAVSMKSAAEMSWDLDTLSEYVKISTNTLEQPDEMFMVTSSLIAAPNVEMNQKVVKCVVTHDMLKERLEISHKIIVYYRPRLVSVTPFKKLSHSEVYKCEADANPPATHFSWHSKHQKIPNEVVKTEGNKLYFLELTSAINGLYICEASNEYGAGIGSLYWQKGKKTEDYHVEL